MRPLILIDVGACTAVGLSAATAAAAVRCNIAGLKEHVRATDRLGEPVIVAGPPGGAGLSVEEAFASMASTALSSMPTLARQDLPGDLTVFLALPEARPGLPANLMEMVCRALADKFSRFQIVVSRAVGHAAAGMAFSEAGCFLERTPNSLAVVLGVDSYDSEETYAWLDAGRQLHTTYNAWGFVPGAAAGACMVGHSRWASMGAPLGVIEDIALTQEAAPIKANGVCLGRGLSEAVERLCDGVTGKVFDGLYCDLNGEVYRSDELGFMLSRSSPRFRVPGDFIAPADCWGDVGAASLPLFVALATQAAARGYSSGPVSLLLAGSENGLRAGMRLRTFVRR